MLQSERPKTARGDHSHYDCYSNSSASSSPQSSARDLCYSPINNSHNIPSSDRDSHQFAIKKEEINRPRTGHGRRQSLILAQEQPSFAPHPPPTMRPESINRGDDVTADSLNEPAVTESYSRTSSAMDNASNTSDKSSKVTTRQRPKTGYGRRRAGAIPDTNSHENDLEVERSRTSLHSSYGRRPSFADPEDFPENGRKSSLNKFPVLPHIGSRRSPYAPHSREETAPYRLDSPSSNPSSDETFSYSLIRQKHDFLQDSALTSQSSVLYDNNGENTRGRTHQSYQNENQYGLHTPPPPMVTPEPEGEEEESPNVELISYSEVNDDIPPYTPERNDEAALNENEFESADNVIPLKIALRLPDGSRHHFNIPNSTTLDELIGMVEKETVTNHWSRQVVSIVDGNRRGFNFSGRHLYQSLNNLNIADKSLLILETLIDDDDEEELA